MGRPAGLAGCGRSSSELLVASLLRAVTFGERSPIGARSHSMAQRRRRLFAPLWVLFFGLFALAVAQSLVFPPDEQSVTFNVLFFACRTRSS